MTKLRNKEKVILGVSGGVDSSAAALLLKQKGFDVIGVHFDIWPPQKEEGKKIGNILPKAAVKAFEMCEKIGIEFIYKNMGQLFEETVISNFCSEYAKGRTPNPCIICNPTIKYKVLLDVANELDAQYIATGHYALTAVVNGIPHIRQSSNSRKDQSYVLYRLPEEVVGRIIFPLGEIEDKEIIKGKAKELGLIDDEYRDSQGICFLGEDQSYNDYLVENGAGDLKGSFYDTEGNKLGDHDGISAFTIGQKKGLGLSLGKVAYIKEINGNDNSIILTYDESDLFITRVKYSDGVFARDVEYSTEENEEFPYFAKTRYAAPLAACKLIEGEVIFKEPQRAPTPGQSVVVYKDDLVIGGGFIL